MSLQAQEERPGDIVIAQAVLDETFPARDRDLGFLSVEHCRIEVLLRFLRAVRKAERRRLAMHVKAREVMWTKDAVDAGAEGDEQAAFMGWARQGEAFTIYQQLMAENPFEQAPGLLGHGDPPNELHLSQDEWKAALQILAGEPTAPQWFIDAVKGNAESG